MKPWLEDSYWQRQRRIGIVKNTVDVEVTAVASSIEALPGVITAEARVEEIFVEYDLRKIDLLAIRSAILNRRITISETPWQRLTRWINQHKEAVRRAEQHLDFGWDAWIQAAYVNRYRLRRHGRRDDRLTNWRQYELVGQSNKPEDEAY